MSFWFNALLRLMNHQKFSNGKKYYVNSGGNNLFDGLTPETAKLTINAALLVMVSGDEVIVAPGFYVESFDLNIDFIRFTCEFGVTIVGTVTISGFAVVYDGCRAAPQSGNGYNITGDAALILGASSVSGAIGFNVTGNFAILDRCIAVGYSATGYNIINSDNILLKAIAQGAGNVRGYYLSDSAADGSLFDRCISNGNELAGYEVTNGAENNIFIDCVSGSKDGNKIDENSTNMWVNFKDELPQQHYEFVYPSVSGLGTASLPITVDNLTTDGGGGTTANQDYWGDTIRIIPKNQITQEYKIYGINIYAITSAKDLMWELLFTNGIEASQNGGNDWDKNETILTVDDASKFLVDDWIWLVGDDVPDGEILIITNIASNVITVEREANVITEDGLRYDYDITPGNNKIFLVHRPSDTLYHKIENSFSASSARDFTPITLFEERTISANGACIMRMCNGTDNLNASFEVRVRGEK